MAHEFYAELARVQLPVFPRLGLQVDEMGEEEGTVKDLLQHPVVNRRRRAFDRDAAYSISRVVELPSRITPSRYLGFRSSSIVSRVEKTTREKPCRILRCRAAV